MEPIVALATPPMNSAIHIIRLSGDKIYDIVNKICKPKLIKKGYQIQRTNLINNNKIIDNVLINTFVSPKSFTGEDIIEINCHGGYYLSQKIIKLLLQHGCQLAKPGEFTMRAVLNNKLNLIQAQAINNLIKAHNDYAIDSANYGLNNQTNEYLKKYKKILFDLIADLEINIDYPDTKKAVNKKQILKTINLLINDFAKIIKTSSQIHKFNNGINIAIVGDVNVGKSSLLNALIKQERAIVTNTPGTTRDIIEASINIGELSFNFFDTAGIRKTNNKIEILGIGKSKDIMNKADLILHVIDGSKKISQNSKMIMNLINNKNHINVINKSDLKNTIKIDGIKISAINHEIEPLIKKIKDQFKTEDLSNKHSLILQSQSTIESFTNYLDKLIDIKNKINHNVPIDLIVQDLYLIFNSLLEILGEKKDFNFINEMFKNFCIGK
jgi:tRNA modification GTPase